ncbi:hypothetical protein QRX60_39460 [Amycolatopsis mongoliensis]|uniref:Uncharacterized protein n=1 Tax=Amycolatopsis mongoliensis TaxID=715475 RepID=A0A9Y2JMK4_9PSEU|nr:hypothetical protein [Amycolatopsis sp. 4-36]WIY00084.1 hypothetical protein QRX60_39460 [Amycolatopsis sp. 4-36]
MEVASPPSAILEPRRALALIAGLPCAPGLFPAVARADGTGGTPAGSCTVPGTGGSGYLFP